MIVKHFNDWQVINEQRKLNKPKASEKKRNKSNKRKYRRDNWVSDSGAEYVLTKKRKSGNSEIDTFVLKGKGKDSPIWDDNGVIVDDIMDFLSHELMSGSNEGKYNEDSIEIEKYKDGKNKDKVTFTIGFATEDEETPDEETPDELEDDGKKPVPKAGTYKSIELPKNDEGETRIEVGQESNSLLELKEMIRVVFSKKGLTLGNQFGMNWLDSIKLEEKDVLWVKALRAGFGMKDANYISQGLVDKMVEQANEWSSTEEPEETEEVASNESTIFKFSDYIKLFEDFDMTAAMKVINTGEVKKEEPTSTSTKTKSKSSSTDSEAVGKSGLTNAQAAAYRTWANGKDKLKDTYGKTSKFDLDATGTNNSFVARSYTQAKADYDLDTGMLKKVWVTTGKPNAWRAEFEKIIGIESGAESKDVEGLPMGYIQYKTGNKIAVHFASPRPTVGTVKAGNVVTFTNGWDAADFGYLVQDIWKDSSGNIGAIYIESPSYVKEFGKPNKDRNFENKAGIVITTQAETSNLKDMFLRTAADDQIAEKISRKIEALWNPSNGYFNKYKDTWNDNEAGAISYFTTWWNGQINPLMNTLKEKDPNKAELSAAFDSIIVKAEGSTANDTATWNIDTLSGSKTYSVDTDF